MTGKRRVRDWQATDPHLRRSPFFEDFSERLGAGPLIADGLLSGLWRFAFCFAQDGDIGKFTPEQIARAVGWEGDVDLMWAALKGSHFIESENQLHHWDEWGGRLFADRHAASDARWDRRNRAKQVEVSEDKSGQSRTMPRGRGRETGREEQGLTTPTDQELPLLLKLTKLARTIPLWRDRADDMDTFKSWSCIYPMSQIERVTRELLTYQAGLTNGKRYKDPRIALGKWLKRQEPAPAEVEHGLPNCRGCGQPVDHVQDPEAVPIERGDGSVVWRHSYCVPGKGAVKPPNMKRVDQ
ncbi:MAG: hypothetical protein ABFE13_11890 [Phycisphaerales bacterium]